ncbi:MAG: hypothetical protein ACW98F_05375 [Candidatus Hodarchaeales archaeon]|jgi:hypothetical protein
MTSSSGKLAKPNVVIGDYYACLDFMVAQKLEEWIIPKLLWIDFRVIPLTFFYPISQKHRSLKSGFYFLEILSNEDYKRILDSIMLSVLSTNGFSSLIVNYPPYCTYNVENWTYLRKLSSSLVVTVLVFKEIFPANECSQFVVGPA